MLSFMDLAKSAVDQQPSLESYVQEWTSRALNRRVTHLSLNEWFDKGHGIVGGTKDHHGIWIPDHTENRRVYLWTPPPK